MRAQSHHFRNDRLVGPFHAKHLGQLLQILSGRLADREHGITEPAHAERAQLFVKELHAQLTCEQRDVFDDRETHAPLLIFGELDDGGQKRLREQFNADDWKFFSGVE